MLTKYYGTVETNQGTGYVYEFVRDYDGNPSRSLRDILEERNAHPTDANIQLVDKALRVFKRELFADPILTTDMDPENFMVQRLSSDTITIRCIDNMGSHSSWPLDLYIPGLLQRRVRNNWNYLMEIKDTLLPKQYKPCVKPMSHSNFSYRRFFGGETLLVLVPHEDDEINTAGATIYGALQEGMRVICVFLTNGDWVFDGALRLQETITMSGEIGLSDEDIVFLGFPDGGPTAQYSVYMHGRQGVVDSFGHKETYGLLTHADFSSQVKGLPTPYTYDGLLTNLEELLVTYEPDAILATDYENHVDHRMCSIVIEEVIGRLLQGKKLKKCPRVFKNFAYGTGYETVKDFYSQNLLSTVMNPAVLTKSTYTTTNPTLAWSDRVRLPVPDDCRSEDLLENPIYKAMYSHISQDGYKRGSRLINGDAVLWERRTDNLVLRAKVEASSGISIRLHDFKLLSTSDLCRDDFLPEDYLWYPDLQDDHKKISLSWQEPQSIYTIRLYGNIDEDNQIQSILLEDNLGHQQEVTLPEWYPMGYSVQWPYEEPIQELSIRILTSRGNQAGFSEIEVFEAEAPSYAYAHITMDGHFAYEWTHFPGSEYPHIGVYCHGLSSEALLWFIDDQEIRYDDLYEQLIKGPSRQTIRCQTIDGQVWCQVVLKKASVWEWGKHIGQHVRNFLRYERSKRKSKKEHKRLVKKYLHTLS